MISKKAASEIIIRQALTDLDRWDLTCKFQISSHNDSKGLTVMLVTEFKDILNEVSGFNQPNEISEYEIHSLLLDWRPSKFIAINEEFYRLRILCGTCEYMGNKTYRFGLFSHSVSKNSEKVWRL